MRVYVRNAVRAQTLAAQAAQSAILARLAIIDRSKAMQAKEQERLQQRVEHFAALAKFHASEARFFMGHP